MKKKKLRYNAVEPIASIGEMLDDSGARYDRAAFLWQEGGEEKSVSYRRFGEEARALGAALSARGLGRIVCIGENSYRWALCYLAVLATGGVFIPLDRMAEDAAILHLVRHSEADAVVYSGKRAEELFSAHREELDGVKAFLSMDATAHTETVLSLDTLVREGEGIEAPAIPEKHPDDVRLLVYTSGTTGDPKGVMLTEHNLVSGVYYGLMVCDVQTRCLSILPYHHTYEAVCGLLVALCRGVTVCINENLRTVLPNLKRYQPDYMYVVPAFLELFYRRIWDQAKKQGKAEKLARTLRLSERLRACGIDLRKRLFSSVRENFGGRIYKFVCGGAPLRREVADFFESIGIRVINGYGITECSPLVCTNRDQESDPDTVGYPLPCLELKIASPDEDGNGEILVRGDVVMKGYFKDEARTAEVLRDGWFYTGDIGHLNARGQLLITGRKKNVIILPNGKNVYPEEIEGALMRLEYVKEVLVRPYEKTGEGDKQGLLAEAFLDEKKLSALSVTDPAARFKADVDAICDTLPPHQRITRTVLRDTEFAKTTSGKIRRV